MDSETEYKTHISTSSTDTSTSTSYSGPKSVDRAVEAVNNMVLHRLVFITLMLVYAVVAWSKGATGVSAKDLSLFVSFLIFISTLCCLAVFGKDLYNFYKNSGIKLFFKNFFTTKTGLKISTLIFLFALYVISTHWKILNDVILFLIEKFVKINA